MFLFVEFGVGFEGKTLIRVFHERAEREGELRVCGRAFIFVLVDFRTAKIKKGIPDSSTHFIRAQRGNEDSDLRAGVRLRATVPAC